MKTTVETTVPSETAVPNDFFETFEEAYEEAQRLRAARTPDNMMSIHVEESQYGDGYRVRVFPASIDLLTTMGLMRNWRRHKGGARL